MSAFCHSHLGAAAPALCRVKPQSRAAWSQALRRLRRWRTTGGGLRSDRAQQQQLLQATWPCHCLTWIPEGLPSVRLYRNIVPDQHSISSENSSVALMWAQVRVKSLSWHHAVQQTMLSHSLCFAHNVRPHTVRRSVGHHAEAYVTPCNDGSKLQHTSSTAPRVIISPCVHAMLLD